MKSLRPKYKENKKKYIEKLKEDAIAPEN